MCEESPQGWAGGDSGAACAVWVLLSCALKGWARIPRETGVSESSPDSIRGTERTRGDGEELTVCPALFWSGLKQYQFNHHSNPLSTKF